MLRARCLRSATPWLYGISLRNSCQCRYQHRRQHQHQYQHRPQRTLHSDSARVALSAVDDDVSGSQSAERRGDISSAPFDSSSDFLVLAQENPLHILRALSECRDVRALLALYSHSLTTHKLNGDIATAAVCVLAAMIQEADGMERARLSAILLGDARMSALLTTLERTAPFMPIIQVVTIIQCAAAMMNVMRTTDKQTVRRDTALSGSEAAAAAQKPFALPLHVLTTTLLSALTRLISKHIHRARLIDNGRVVAAITSLRIIAESPLRPDYSPVHQIALAFASQCAVNAEEFSVDDIALVLYEFSRIDAVWSAEFVAERDERRRQQRERQSRALSADEQRDEAHRGKNEALEDARDDDIRAAFETNKCDLWTELTARMTAELRMITPMDLCRIISAYVHAFNKAPSKPIFDRLTARATDIMADFEWSDVLQLTRALTFSPFPSPALLLDSIARRVMRDDMMIQASASDVVQLFDALCDMRALTAERPDVIALFTAAVENPKIRALISSPSTADTAALCEVVGIMTRMRYHYTPIASARLLRHSFLKLAIARINAASATSDGADTLVSAMTPRQRRRAVSLIKHIASDPYDRSPALTADAMQNVSSHFQTALRRNAQANQTASTTSRPWK